MENDFDPLDPSLPPLGSQPLPVGQEQLLGGRYRLGQVLSLGAVGAVYDGVDTETGRPVVIKMMQWWEEDPKALARFRREAEAARALQHPNIVEVLDIRQSDGVQYFVMEKVAGEELGRLLRGNRQVPNRKVAIITQQLTSALAAVHAHGVVHRDVKPGNILVADFETPDPLVKLIDFGVAKVVSSESHLTGDRHILGALGYMAPEQAMGKSSEADQRADVYALGAIVYRMITGRQPIRGTTMVEFAREIMTQAPPPPSEFAPVSPELEAVLLKCLARSRDDRYPTVEAFWAALEPALA
ncbi:MAG: serine/threonine-protein kinase [Polyangiaceae bacterium]